MYLHCLEVHLCDVCNLNCRGCTHFANIETEPNFPEPEAFTRDLTRMGELFDGIKLIRLMGGEPLKNKDFVEYVRIARSIFDKSEICLVSNGLLIPEVSPEALKALAQLNVSISISLYPPTQQIKPMLIEIFEGCGIRYSFTKPITRFRKRIDVTASNDKEENFRTCLFKDYSFLYHGKFALCSAPILIGKFNKAFGQDLDVSEDVVDIYDPRVDKAYMESYMQSQKDCCKYCGKPEEFDWSNQGQPRMEDWLI